MSVQFSPTSRTTRGSHGFIQEIIADEVEFASHGEGFAGRITVNTSPDGSTYYMTWHGDDGKVQVDTFTSVGSGVVFGWAAA